MPGNILSTGRIYVLNCWYYLFNFQPKKRFVSLWLLRFLLFFVTLQIDLEKYEEKTVIFSARKTIEYILKMGEYLVLSVYIHAEI